MMVIPLPKNLKFSFIVLHLLDILSYLPYCKTEMTNIHTSIYSLEKLSKDENEFVQLLEKYVSERNQTENFDAFKCTLVGISVSTKKLPLLCA